MKLIIYFIELCASMVANSFVYCFFHKEQSLYFSLLKLISLFEISFIYSKFLFLFTRTEEGCDICGIALVNKIKDNFKDGKDIFDIITFKIFKDFKYTENVSYFYNTMKKVYILLNIFVCIETINLITRPFSQSKKKANLYYIISIISIVAIFCLEIFIHSDDFDKYFDLGLYLLFVLIGIISIIFVIIRFCLHKPLIQSAKNFFVMRHLIYIIVLSGMFVNELQCIDYNTFVQNVIIFIMGFVMSIIKISDELCAGKASKKKSKKKGVASIITSNLNVEFMCCILYGMTDIFIRNQNRKPTKKIDFSKKEKKTHTIKYINTIDSKIEDIKDIKLHVSSSQLGESLLKPKADAEDSNLDISNNYSNIKESVNSTLNNDTNSKGEDAIIIEYLPDVFNELRKDDEITDDVMIRVFSPSKNKSAIEKMSESKGKSGSFFFYSHDRKFIIKTISSDERKTLLDIFHDYFNYIKEHKTTLITKIYGVYTLVIKNASSVNIILMQNLFGCSPIHIQRMFDLKGSTVQRKTKDVQKWKREQVLKDLDFQWLTKVERKLINFKKKDIDEIKTIVNNDVIFYKRLRLMDYSLLFIIVDFPNKIDPDYNQIVGLLDDPKYRGHVYKSEHEKYIYIIGIIDYLQKYNLKKKMEHCMKGIINGKENNMISAVDPEYYGNRFNEFMQKNVFVMGEKE